MWANLEGDMPTIEQNKCKFDQQDKTLIDFICDT